MGQTVSVTRGWSPMSYMRRVSLVLAAAALGLASLPSLAAANATTGVTIRLFGPQTARTGAMIELRALITDNLKYGGGDKDASFCRGGERPAADRHQGHLLEPRWFAGAPEHPAEGRAQRPRQRLLPAAMDKPRWDHFQQLPNGHDRLSRRRGSRRLPTEGALSTKEVIGQWLARVATRVTLCSASIVA